MTVSTNYSDKMVIATKLHQSGQLEEAKSIYFALLKETPAEANIYARLGTIFDASGNLQEAVNFYESAIKLNPEHVAAHYNLANAYRDMSNFSNAIPHYKAALNINPNHYDALASFHHTLQHVCKWDEYDAITPILDKANAEAISQNRRTPETPFVNITRCDDEAYNMQIANSWANYIKQASGARPGRYKLSDRKIKKDKLKIGYLSRDFQDRPTGHLTRALYALHDRDKYEIYAYSYGANDGSDYRRYISASCDKFVDIERDNFIAAADRIYQDGIDILVDMQGYMAGSRLEIAAMRPAPVQVSYLGFPGTIGGGLFDYTITDKICVPECQLGYYAEKIAYLPNCYQVNDFQQIISDKIFKRSDFGLPDSAFVFCSFNWSHKLDKIMFSTWLEILREVPNSVLWLWKSSDLTEDNLKSFAAANGVDTNRLVFSGKLPKAEHLARLSLADLALDTRIYGGHTTTSDSLWAGIPVVTIKGRHFASRVCASLLANIGLNELVVEDIASYKNLAINLAKNIKQIQNLKQHLSLNKNSSNLFNTKNFTFDLESLYQEIFYESIKIY